MALNLKGKKTLSLHSKMGPTVNLIYNALNQLNMFIKLFQNIFITFKEV